jgi:superoxide dismutase, Fe-Mn family
LGSWVNHQLYWNNLSPHGGAMSKPFENAMNEQFGNIYNFKIEFIKNALKMRCCGWTWLIKNKSGETGNHQHRRKYQPLNEKLTQSR